MALILYKEYASTLEKSTIHKVSSTVYICNIFFLNKDYEPLKALADECEFKLDQAGYQIDHREGMEAGSWILLDYIDIIVHIYNTDSRKYYDLERFWKDGIELNIDDILKESDK